MKFRFRQTQQDDYNFLWQLNKSLFMDFVNQIWGWDEDWQKEHFDENFDPANSKIIVCENCDAGFLKVIEKPDVIFLVSILILPEFQNKGIGSQIIKNLIETSDKPVELRVLKINPARKLYKRLGFEIINETKTHFNMRFSPAFINR